MAITVGDAVLKLGVDTKDMERGLGKLKGTIQRHNKAIGIAMTAMGGAILAVGISSIKTFAQMGDEVQKMALRTGFSTEALSELRHAAEISGADLSTLEKGIKRMSMAILDAKDGLAETKRAFEHVGIAAEDLMGLSPEEQFFKIANGIAAIEDPTMRAALAQKILGRAGTSLLPLFSQGAEGMAKLRQEAHELGIVFDQEAADKAANMTDAMARLKESVSGVKMAIADHLIPVLMPLVQKIKDTIANISTWMREHPKLTKIILIATGVIGGLLLILGPLLIILPSLTAGFGIFGAAIHFALGPIGLIILAIAALTAAGIALWKNWDKVARFFQDMWSNIKIIFAQAIKFLVKTVLQPFLFFIDKFIGTVIGVLGSIVGFFNKDWGDAIKGVADKLHNLDDEIVNWADGLIESERAVKANRDAQRELEESTEDLTEVTEDSTEVLEDNTEALEDNKEALEDLKKAQEKATRTVEDAIRQFRYERSEAGRLRLSIKDVINALILMGKSEEYVADTLASLGDEQDNVLKVMEAFEITALQIAEALGLEADEAERLVSALEGIKAAEEAIEAPEAPKAPKVPPEKPLPTEQYERLKARIQGGGGFLSEEEAQKFYKAAYAASGMIWEVGKGVAPGVAGKTDVALASAFELVQMQLARAIERGLEGLVAMSQRQLAEIEAETERRTPVPAQHGGIAMNPMLVSVAEKRPEVLIPLDKLERMGFGGGKGIADIYIYLDGRVIAQAIGQPLVDEIRLRTGVRI